MADELAVPARVLEACRRLDWEVVSVQSGTSDGQWYGCRGRDGVVEMYTEAGILHQVRLMESFFRSVGIAIGMSYEVAVDWAARWSLGEE